MINLECWCFNCQLICLQYWIRNLLWIHFRTRTSIHNVGDYGKMPSNQPCQATYILILWSYIIYVVRIWILAAYCRCIIFREYLFSRLAEPKSIREYANSRYKHWMRHIYYKYVNSCINIRSDHVTAKTAKINTQRNILLLLYILCHVIHRGHY